MQVQLTVLVHTLRKLVGADDQNLCGCKQVLNLFSCATSIQSGTIDTLFTYFAAITKHSNLFLLDCPKIACERCIFAEGCIFIKCLENYLKTSSVIGKTVLGLCLQNENIWLTIFLFGFTRGRLVPFILQQRPHALHKQWPLRSRRQSGVEVAAQFTHSRPSVERENSYLRHVLLREMAALVKIQHGGQGLALHDYGLSLTPSAFDRFLYFTFSKIMCSVCVCVCFLLRRYNLFERKINKQQLAHIRNIYRF